jgi:hypothetical protein
MGKRKKRKAPLEGGASFSPINRVSSSPVVWFPRFLGLSIFAGLSIMHYYYYLGVAIVYLGLGFLLWEVCVDPLLTRRSLPLRVVLIGLVFVLFDAFSIGIVEAQAPLSFQSYAMKKGEYPKDTTIGGIAWDSHLTDLRVTATNPTDDDYENLDVEVQPDKWTYKAALLSSSSGCDLSPMGGETVFVALNVKGGNTTITSTRFGNTFDAHDNVGDVFSPLASAFGYRLRCGKLPAHFTVQIVFAVVTLNPSLVPEENLHNMPKGTWGLSAAELAGVHSIFELFESRPSPSIIQVKGQYVRILKPFKIDRSELVQDGN